MSNIQNSTTQAQQTRSQNRSASRKRSLLWSAVASVLALGPAVALADGTQKLYWDPTGSGSGFNGGSGTWDTSSLFWVKSDFTTPNVKWTNWSAGGNFNSEATFYSGLTLPQTVTVSGTIEVNRLDFGADGYTLTGGTLALFKDSTHLTRPTLDLIDLSIGFGTATINSNMVNATGVTGTQNIQKSGGGTLILGGDNSGLAGTFRLDAGTLAFSAANNISGFTSIDLNNSTTFRYDGAGLVSLSAPVKTLATGFTTSTFEVSSATGTLQLATFGEASASSLAGMIKTGAGTLSLSGVLDYTGPTTVSAGTLVLNADSSTGTQTGFAYGLDIAGTVVANASVAVNAGATLRLANGATGSAVGVAPVTVAAADTLLSLPAAIIEGNGRITSNVTLNGVARANGGNALALAGNVTANNATIQRDGTSSLTFGNTVLNGTTSMAFPLTTTAVTGLTTGTLTVNGLTNIDLAGSGAISAGTYKLIDYTGAGLSSAQFSRLKVLNMPGGFISGVVNNTTGTSVDAVFETAGASNTWVGTTGVWDTVAANWTTNPYADGQQVTFDNTGTTKAVTGAAVAPQKITVNNTAGNDYSIANNIGGLMLGGLVKTGTGKLTLTGANTFAGPVSVSGGGTLVANASTAQSSLGNGAVSLNGSTLQINATGSNVVGLGGRYYNSGNQNWTAGYLFANNAPAVAQAVVEGNVNYNNTLDDLTPRVLPIGVGSATATEIQNFSIEWVGKINIPVSGNYKFYTSSDDGTRVNIDGRLAATSDGGHGMVEGGGIDVYLEAGLHDFRALMTQGGGGAGHIISWASTDAGIPKQAIPASAFRLPEFNTATAGGYSNLVVVGTGLNVAGASVLDLNSIDANTLGVGFSNMSLASGATLTINGASRKMVEGTGLKLGYDAATDAFSGGTATISATADVRVTGALDDGGQNVTLVKNGAGALFVETRGAGGTLGTGSTLQMNGSELIATGEWVGDATTGSWQNPLGSAKIQLNGGSKLTLDTRRQVNFGALGSADLAVAQPIFANAIEMNDNATIQSNIQGKQTILGNSSNSITIPSGKTLTIDAVSGVSGGSTAGAPIRLDSQLTGSGGLTIRSTAWGQGTNRATVSLNATGNNFTGPTLVESGILRLAAYGTEPSASTITVNAGATFDLNSQFATITSINGAGTIATGGGTINLGADNSNSTFTGNITGGGNITKNGTGILTLTGNNTNGVTLYGGTLRATGTLSGYTSIGDGSNPATLSPHASPTETGVLNMNSNALTLNNNATLALNLSSSTAFFDRITGLAGITLNNNPVTVSSTGGSIALGSYNIINLVPGGSISGTLTGPANTATRKYTLLSPSDVGGQPDKFLLVVDTFTFRWDGNLSSNWDLATANWKNEANASANYVDDTRALFNDLASGTTSVTLGANRTAIEARFDNSTKNYTLGGAGALIGTGSLVKTGTGSLTINNANLYTGTTSVQNGAVILGNAAALPAASLVDIAAAGTLRLGTASTTGSLTGSGTVDLNGNVLSVGADSRLSQFAGKITGTGGLTKTGTGTQILASTLPAASDYVGPIAINTGTLRVARGEDLGAVSNSITIASGAALGLSNTFVSGSHALTIPSGGNGRIEVANPIAFFSNVASNMNVDAATTLTKTGTGVLSITSNQTNFTGKLVIDENSYMVRLIGPGRMNDLTSLDIGPGSRFEVNLAQTTTGLTAGHQIYTAFSDTAPITIRNGGFLFFRGLDNGNNNLGQENVGVVTAKDGMAFISAHPQSNGRARLNLGGLNRDGLGAMFFLRSYLMGESPDSNNRGQLSIADAGAPALVNGIIGGWAIAADDDNFDPMDFATYGTGAAGGAVPATTKLIVPLAAGTRPTLVGSTLASDNVRVVAAETLIASKTIHSLKLDSAIPASSVISIGDASNANVQLVIGSGGILSTGSNVRTLTSTNGGTLTAGNSGNVVNVNGTDIRQLYMMIGSGINVLTLGATITDNVDPVAVVFADSGNVTYANTVPNTYSGGTVLNRGGNIQANGNVDGRSFGSGKVMVHGAQLILVQPGSTSYPGTLANPTYIADQNGQIFLPDNTSALAGNETFRIESGSVLVVRAVTPNLNTATNLSLADGAIIANQDPNNSSQIQGLGTTPKYFIGFNGTFIQNNTIGNGTPWMGLSTDRGDRDIDAGTTTITPGTTEVIFQGLTWSSGTGNTVRRINLGNGNDGDSPVLAVSNPVDIKIVGRLGLNDSTAVYSDMITFVVQPGARLDLRQNYAFGGGAILDGNNLPIGVANPSQRAKVVTMAGSVIDADSGATYAINGPLVMTPSSMFLANDGGTAQYMKGSPDASVTFQTGSILNITNANGITGDLITPASFQPGSIIRYETDNIVGISTKVAPHVIYELYGNSRTLTSQTVVENVTIGAGGGITNDVSSRTLNQGWGSIEVTTGGAFVSATTNTTLTLGDNFNIGNNTLTFGSLLSVDGAGPKLGLVSINTGGSTSGVDGVYSILPGVQVNSNANHAIPDLATVDIGAGGHLLLTQNDFVESVGGLSGAGNVTTNQGGSPVLQVGWNNKSTTFSGAFTNAAPGNNMPHLRKVGTGTLTLTGVSTSTDEMWAIGGEIKLAEGGKTAFGGNFITKGGTLTLDNTVTPINDRLGGATKPLTTKGGTFRIVGNATTAVTENLAAFTIDLGHSILSLDATGTAGITLNVASVSGTDANRGTMLIRSPMLGATAGAGVANFKATTPNLRGAGGAAGSATMSIRPDILLDASPTGLGTTFVTYDATNGFRGLLPGEYAAALTDGNGAGARPNVSTSLPAVLTTTASASGLIMKSGASISGTGDLSISGIIVDDNVTTSIAGVNLRSGNNGGDGPVVIYTMPGSTLDLNVQVAATGAGINKNYSGTLNLNRRNFYGQGLNINDGLVNLNGGLNTLSFDWRTNGTTNLRLAGGTVDLKGNSQVLNEIHGTSFLNTAGSVAGTITNSAGGTPVELMANGNAGNASDGFSGTISGNLNFTKHGSGTVNYTNPHTYTGTTRVIGGTARYRELGVMPGNTLDLNYAQVYFDSRSSFVEPLPHGTQRFSPTLEITSRGGQFRVDEMPGHVENNTVAKFTVLEGQNSWETRSGQSGTSILTLGEFDRQTVTPGTSLRVYGDNLGRIGNTGTTGQQDSRIIINNFDGSAIPDATYLPAWVVVNDGHFAYYRTANGLTEVNQNGAPAYATTLASGNTTNLAAATITLAAGDQVTRALRLDQGATLTLNFAAATQLLNLESGGLLRSNNNNATTIGSAATPGKITAGGTQSTGTAELFFHFNQNTATVNSLIVDNPNGAAVALVKTHGGTVNLLGASTYTGPTVVNAGTLGTTGAAASTIIIPSDQIYVHGGATLTVAGAGQLKAGGPTLNLRGGATVNINGSNPVAAIDYFNSGGNGNPNLAIGTGATASLAGNVTVSQQQLIYTPTISGAGILDLGTPTAGDTHTTTFNVSVPANIAAMVDSAANQYPLGLNVSAIVQNAKIVKTGNAMMSLSGANPNIWSIDVQQGALRYDNATSLGSTSTVINLAPGTALIGNNGGAAQTVVATMNMDGGRILTANQNVTFTGAMNINADTNFYLNDVWHGVGSRTTTLTGVLAGDAARTITADAKDVRPVWTQILQVRNTGNTYAGGYLVKPGAILESRANQDVDGNQVGSALGSSTIELAGGGLNIRDNGVLTAYPKPTSQNLDLAYNNNIIVSSTALSTISVARGSNPAVLAPGTGNLDAANNNVNFSSLTLRNASQVLVSSGDGYRMGVTGTTTVEGAGATLANTATVNLNVIDGPGLLNKFGAGTVNVNQAVAGTRTGGIAVKGGTVSVNLGGKALGDNLALTIDPVTDPVLGLAKPNLTLNAGTGNTVDLTVGSATVTNNGTVRVQSGTADFGTRGLIGSGVALNPLTMSVSTMAERYLRPGDVGLANFDTGTAVDPFILFHNATTFLNSATVTGTGTLVQGQSIDFNTVGALRTHGGVAVPGDHLGATFDGTITVGSASLPVGVISFGTNSDDGSTLYVDLNKNGTFEANEMIVDNRGSHGPVIRTGAVDFSQAGLGAGDYRIAIGWFNGYGPDTQVPAVQAGLAPGGAVGAPLAFSSLMPIGPNAPLNFTSNVQVDANATLKAGGVTTYGMIVNGTAEVANIRATGALAIGAGGSAVLAANGGAAGASKVGSLNMAGATDAWTGKLDLNDNSLVIPVGGATLANTINQVKQGRADGAWNGLGITSTAAANDTRKITGLGVIANNDGAAIPAPIMGSLDGQTTVLDDILVKYTYNGDSDLSGVVDADDYFQIDAGFLSAGTKTGWRWGDYNYDGLIDIDDYFLIDVAYSLQSGPLGGSSTPAAPSAPSAAVPEPGTLSLLALGAAALLGRRRRSR